MNQKKTSTLARRARLSPAGFGLARTAAKRCEGAAR
jgi:hypothetical protein